MSGNFQLIPWTVGTLRIQRPDQNGTKKQRTGNYLVNLGVWKMTNYSQGKMIFLSCSQSFCWICWESLHFAFLFIVFPETTHFLRKRYRSWIWKWPPSIHRNLVLFPVHLYRPRRVRKPGFLVGLSSNWQLYHQAQSTVDAWFWAKSDRFSSLWNRCLELDALICLF